MALFKSKYSVTKVNPKSFNLGQLPFLLMVLPVAAFMVLPLLYIFNHAFKPFDELLEYPPKFFVSRPTFNNFKELFKASSTTAIPVSRYLFNSIVVTLIVVVLSIILSSMAGFALSKLKFHVNKVINEVNTIALMFVGVAVTIPKYMIIEKLGFVDNFFVHIVPILAIPVGLFLIKQTIDDIPNELIEAAKMDGASSFRIYWSIILPMIKPAMATVAILAFQNVWNDASISATYLNDDTLKTFAYYVSTLSSASNSTAGMGMSAAATLIMFLPNLIIFIVLQGKVMSTMAHSGIK